MDFRASFRIHSGLVALDPVKPVRYQEARFAGALGAAWIEAPFAFIRCFSRGLRRHESAGD